MANPSPSHPVDSHTIPRREPSVDSSTYSGSSISVHANNNSKVIIQNGGSNNTQNVSFNGDISLGQYLNKLRIAVNETQLDDLDKEEIHAQISRIEDLSSKPRTPDVLERIYSKLDNVGGIIQKAQDVAILISPLLEGIRRFFSGA